MPVYTEKEILGDALSTQKASTSLYNMLANECSDEALRRSMIQILEQEHTIQKAVFQMMHDNGYYPTPEADSKKIEEAKQKFACGVK